MSREDDAGAGSKADSCRGARFAPCLDRNFIAVLQEAALRTIGQVNWLCSAPSIFEQAAAAVFGFTADGSAPDEIATVHWTSRTCMMGKHLSKRPC